MRGAEPVRALCRQGKTLDIPLHYANLHVCRHRERQVGRGGAGCSLLQLCDRVDRAL